MSVPKLTDTAGAALDAVMSRIADYALSASAAALVGIVFVQAWQVIARYGLNSTPGWSEPLTLLLLNVCMSMGAAAGVQKRAHFRFDLVTRCSPTWVQAILARLQAGVVLVLGVVLSVHGFLLAVESIDIPMAGAQLPQGAIYLPLSLGGALMAIFALHQGISPRTEGE